MVNNAPYNTPIHNIWMPAIMDEESIATTWRRYKKIKGME